MFRLVLYSMTPFVPLRFVLGWGAACVMSILVWGSTIVFGGDRPDRYGKLQRQFVNLVSNITGRVVLFSLSSWWTFYSRPKVCYKKWLGPDWKPSYKNPGCKIGNHSSFCDILVHM